ncbi:MAG: AAA family ATPase [Treponema sp.]
MEAETETKKPYEYISEITLNTSEKVSITQNDIVVFVGPNNAGKSQSLRDIYELSESRKNPVVITDIKIQKDLSGIKNLLNSYSVSHKTGDITQYKGFQFTINNHAITSTGDVLNQLRNVFVTYLNTESRLGICSPPGMINRTQPKQHPIHFAAFDPRFRQRLSENFKRAFGVDITPDTQFGQTIPLCMGEPIHFTQDFLDEQLRLEAYAEELGKYPQVQNQGDGIRSFTGILLNLMIDYYCTFLIDEPESFLHPPQAYIMGQIIGENLTDKKQAFISTHSEEIIKGLLAVCSDRVKIIRITRDGNINHFSILDNKRIHEVWNDPLLKYSNIMTGLFHKTVVLCESDSDCKFYSIIAGYLAKQQNKYDETLFIHCGGKQRMAKTAAALKALNVTVKLIPDIDVLNDEDTFRRITDASGIDWNSIQPDYRIIVSNIQNQKDTVIKRKDFKDTVDGILSSATEENLSKGELKKIQSAVKVPSKWEVIKHGGIAAFPAGDATIHWDSVNARLKENDVFIVPCGELECFIKEVGGHGPEWVNTVLETYSHLDDPVYEKVKKFIEKLDL